MGEWYPQLRATVLGWARTAKASTEQAVTAIQADPDVQRLAEQARTSETAQSARTAIDSAVSGGQRYLADHPTLGSVVETGAALGRGLGGLAKEHGPGVARDAGRVVDGLARFAVDALELGVRKVQERSQQTPAEPPPPPKPPDETT